MSDQLKEKVLYLLESDCDVVNAVKKIIFNHSTLLNESNENKVSSYDCNKSLIVNETEQLRNTIKKLEDEKEILLKEKHDLEKENHDMKMVNATYKDKLNEMKQNEKILLQKVNEFNDYEKEFKRLKNVYDKYCKLDEEIFYSLERILNKTEVRAETAEKLFAYGMQEDNFIALWELISNNYQLYENKGCLDDMRYILLYFMNNIIEVSSKGIEVILPKLGDRYDERYCTRTPTSNATGYITKIILPGLYNSKGIIKKTLVEVK